MSVLGEQRSFFAFLRKSLMCHVWTAPGWQGESSRRRVWSVQPCVRPVSAVLMTAGHNALRGSGPSQKHTFEDAMARVGCPDRRIDRHCITCCSPPNRHVTPGSAARSRLRRESGGFLVAFVPGHHRPGHPGEFVGEREGSNLGGSPTSPAAAHGSLRPTTPFVRGLGQ